MIPDDLPRAGLQPLETEPQRRLTSEDLERLAFNARKLHPKEAVCDRCGWPVGDHYKITVRVLRYNRPEEDKTMCPTLFYVYMRPAMSPGAP